MFIIWYVTCRSCYNNAEARKRKMRLYLKVALQVDPSIDRSGVKNTKRLWTICSTTSSKYVDEILVYETEDDLLNLIKTQTMHIRFLSEEYINKNFTGKQYCMDNGIELYYHKREHKYSSSEIRNRTYELELAKRNEQSNNNPN